MSDRITDRLRDVSGGKKKVDPDKWQRIADNPTPRTMREDKQKEKRKEEQGIYDDEFEDMDSSDAILESDDAARSLEEEAANIKAKARNRVVTILLIVLCAYVGILIFGVFMTDYAYNTQGQIAPVILSVKDRREKNAFEVVQAQYENCRILYEETLVLDYRVSTGLENTMVIAPEYEALLDEVTNLSVKVEALSVDTQYSQIQSLLLTWIQDDIAVYLQNMSAALSENNEETLGNALVDAERVYNDFSIITQNIVAFGETINGVDLTEAIEWSPEGYIDEYVNGTTR